MTVTPYDFHHMTGLNFEGAIINLDGVSSIQLGLDMLGRKYSTETIHYFDLVLDYMILPQELQKSAFGWLGLFFYICWELISSLMVGK